MKNKDAVPPLCYTKRQLAVSYDITMATVNNTLKKCGFDHKLPYYTESQRKRFEQVRILLKLGYRNKEIQEILASGIFPKIPKNFPVTGGKIL